MPAEKVYILLPTYKGGGASLGSVHASLNGAKNATGCDSAWYENNNDIEGHYWYQAAERGKEYYIREKEVKD